MLFRRNDPKNLLKIKELVFPWAQDNLLPIKEDLEGISGAKNRDQSQTYGEKSTTYGAFPCLRGPQ
jgi:hypothetical protein